MNFTSFSLAPIRIGILSLYAADRDNFFVSDQAKYPAPNYYEQTGLRLGLHAGLEMATFEDRLRVIYELVFLDSGVVASMNNSVREANYYLGSGMKVKFYF
ncbi:MAG: hypothetical protein AB7F86_02085 [Bdellovibrionales bacterium]